MQTIQKAILISMLAVGCTVSQSTVRADQPPTPSDMVYIEHGSSVMGIDREAPLETGKKLTAYEKRMMTPWSAEAFTDEGPAHTVLLDSYFIDQYEISNKQYGHFIKATGHPAPAYWDDPRLSGPDQPVVGVNWHDAKAYCEYRGKRLPTEAEWEKAARGPQGNIYPWGNDFDPEKANYGKNQSATTPVTSYSEGVSHYGVHNMAGNVFEWVSDWYDPHYYGESETSVNPSGPSKPIWLGGTGTYVDRLTVGEKRVIRGGSWIAPESTLRTTHRFWNHPLNNSYGVGLGFRCAMSAQTVSDEARQDGRDAFIQALVAMGAEKNSEALSLIKEALAAEPDNREYLATRDLLMRSMQKK